MSIYCTYLTIYRGNKLPPFYIGHSTEEKIHKGYRGSVGSKDYKNIWLDEIKARPQSFRTVIIKRFETKAEAIAHEIFLQEMFQVHTNPMYINRAIANNKFYVPIRTPEHSAKIGAARKGKKMSAEAIRKMADSKRGKPLGPKGPMPQHMKDHLSNILRGRPRSSESVQKGIQSRNGYTHSEETKIKLRKPKKDTSNMGNHRPLGYIWVNNGFTQKMVSTNFVEAGWILGRLNKPTPPQQKGKIWITNGVINKMVDANDILDGWWRGRTL